MSNSNADPFLFTILQATAASKNETLTIKTTLDVEKDKRYLFILFKTSGTLQPLTIESINGEETFTFEPKYDPVTNKASSYYCIYKAPASEKITISAKLKFTSAATIVYRNLYCIAL